MTDYVLWTRGMRGPEISILHNRDRREPLNEFERGRKIGDAVELTAMNESMTLEEARHWFPCPKQSEEAA